MRFVGRVALIIGQKGTRVYNSCLCVRMRPAKGRWSCSVPLQVCNLIKCRSVWSLHIVCSPRDAGAAQFHWGFVTWSGTDGLVCTVSPIPLQDDLGQSMARLAFRFGRWSVALWFHRYLVGQCMLALVLGLYFIASFGALCWWLYCNDLG